MGSCTNYFKERRWAAFSKEVIFESAYTQNKIFPETHWEPFGSIMHETFFSTTQQPIKEHVKKVKEPEFVWISPSMKLFANQNIIDYTCLRSLQCKLHEYINDLDTGIAEDHKIFEEDLIKEVLQKKMKFFQKTLEIQVQKTRDNTKCEFYQIYSLEMKVLFDKLKKEFEEELVEKERLLRWKLECEKEKIMTNLNSLMKKEAKEYVKETSANNKTKLEYLKEWDATEKNVYYKEKLMYYLKVWERSHHEATNNYKAKIEKALIEADRFHFNFMKKIIEKEREKFSSNLYHVLRYFYDKLKEMNHQINSLKDYIHKMDIENLKILEKKAWICVITDTLLQYQKFINFFLQAVPGQANYLLSLAEICKKRIECIRRIRQKNIALPWPEECKPKQWGQIIIEPDESIDIPYVPMAGSEVCNEKFPWNFEELRESLVSITEKSKSEEKPVDKSKKVVDWLVNELLAVNRNRPGQIRVFDWPILEEPSDESFKTKCETSFLKKPCPMIEEPDISVCSELFLKQKMADVTGESSLPYLIGIFNKSPSMRNVIIKP